MTRADVKGPMQVMQRMMKRLDVLSDYRETVSLRTLAQETGLHPFTAHSILSAMNNGGCAERAMPWWYRLGTRLLELGNLVKARIPPIDAATDWRNT